MKRPRDELRLVVRDVDVTLSLEDVSAALSLRSSQLTRFCRTTRGVKKPLKLVAVLCVDEEVRNVKDAIMNVTDTPCHRSPQEYHRVLALGKVSIAGHESSIEESMVKADSAAARGRVAAAKGATARELEAMAAAGTIRLSLCPATRNVEVPEPWVPGQAAFVKKRVAPGRKVDLLNQIATVLPPEVIPRNPKL